MENHSRNKRAIVNAPVPLGPEGYQRAFQQFTSLFIEPEIKRRQSEGSVPTPFPLWAAQVLLFGDGRPARVRLNHQVPLEARVKLAQGKVPQLDEPLSLTDIDDIQSIKPILTDDIADCGHFTALLFKSRWLITFDFRYNKRLAARHLEVAEQFLTTAKRELYRRRTPLAVAPFVDNLFSAAELAARAQLLGTPDPKFTRKGSHRAIQTRFNRWASLGNTQPEHRDVLNKLSGLRDRARYRLVPVTIQKTDARIMFKRVHQLLAETRRHTQ